MLSYVIISGVVHKKITKRDCFKQHPCLSNQMSRALMSNSFGSLHIRNKLGKSRVLAKNRVFRGKTRFYLPLPDKTDVYSQTREISRVWRYRVYIFIYIIYIILSVWGSNQLEMIGIDVYQICSGNSCWDTACEDGWQLKWLSLRLHLSLQCGKPNNLPLI